MMTLTLRSSYSENTGFDIVQDPGASQGTLALVARHQMTAYPQKSKGRGYFRRQYVAYNAVAIRSAKDRIGDAEKNESDDIVAAIMLLAYDVRDPSFGLLDNVITGLKANIFK
jgi:hypothetical protein